MILRQAFMSLAGANLSILQQGVHFDSFLHIQIDNYTVNFCADTFLLMQMGRGIS